MDIHRQFGKRAYMQTYRMPDGREENFFNFSGLVTPSIGMPITRGGNVVLLRQFRFGANDFVYEVPGGSPKEGQSPEDAMRMELEEEAGYECGGEIIRLREKPILFEPAACGTKFWPLLLIDCSRKHEPRTEPNEIVEVLELPLEIFIAQIGTIKLDSKTLAITLLALPHLGYKIGK